MDSQFLYSITPSRNPSAQNFHPPPYLFLKSSLTSMPVTNSFIATFPMYEQYTELV